MRGRTHLIIGTLATAGVIIYTREYSSIAVKSGMLAAGIIGSLLPDIDTKDSIISKTAKPLRLFHSVLFKIFGRHNKHRWITHGLFYAVMLSIGLFALLITKLEINTSALISLSFAVGIFTHDFCDMLSGGVVFLSPVLSHRFTIAKIKTASKKEHLFVFLAILGSILLYCEALKII